MFGLIKRKKKEVKNQSVYMEVYGDNRIAYRVISGTIGEPCSEYNIITYGVETEDFSNGEKESIQDFSRNIEDAVDFTEMLISKKIKPCQMYSMALNYLYVSI